METRIRLTWQAQELLNHSSIVNKGCGCLGEWLIRHNDEVHFKEHHEYNHASFAKKLGIKLPTQSYLKKLASLTDANEYTEALLEVARWAADNAKNNTYFPLFIKSLEELIRIHEEMGHCMYSNTRLLLMKSLFIEIEEVYGITIKNQLYKCL